MLPTYSFSDIKAFITSFELAEIVLLNDLIAEELDRYAEYESKAIFKIIHLRKKALNQNMLQVEYLLAYN